MQDDELEALDWAANEPALAGVHRLARLVQGIAWFDRAGLALSPADAAIAEEYLDALGVPEVRAAALDDWRDAAALAGDGGFGDAAEVEANAHHRLVEQASAKLDPELLGNVLDALTAIAAPVARDRAARLRDRFAIDDESFTTIAAGAVMQAVEQAALVLIVAEEDDNPHDLPLIHRFRLFEAGRWPLFLAGSSLHIF